ncbi:helix-turn-helix domain-containing protein [Conexibacter sp. W3-3-2]|uniref:helix-turn-helix domain-containing protein n=1 Tax=Conexibacter sp. W3-3-2 TaxID=2675227 RepID=UPI0012B7F75D|nr:helix-turn-helix domain-containing protein [Conexibacter sp. W3-3-2]MTD44154.1 helix-turn-helix domain-containing protein [Conexibacter sp. W3-3-2]
MSTTPNLPTLGTLALDASTCMLIGEVIARHMPTYMTYADKIGDDPWLDAEGAARHLGITVDAVYKRARRGDIPAHQDRPGARLFFDRRELDASRRTGRR